jgi:hypothetical protein
MPNLTEYTENTRQRLPEEYTSMAFSFTQVINA